jgi:Uma2 family endonuclease
VEPGHPSTRFSDADLELLPQDDRRHEIIDGEHFVSASPVTRHQRISRRLLVARAHLLTAKNLQGAPDLVIEILSPSTRRLDERLKRDLYERGGVDEYWLGDPDRHTLTIYRREGSRFPPPETFDAHDVVSTPLLPGFELPLATVLR